MRFNDFAFAAHALVLVILTYSQFFSGIWGFDVPKGQRTSTAARLVVLASIVSVFMAVTRAAATSGTGSVDAIWTWIDVVRSL